MHIFLQAFNNIQTTQIVFIWGVSSFGKAQVRTKCQTRIFSPPNCALTPSGSHYKRHISQHIRNSWYGISLMVRNVRNIASELKCRYRIEDLPSHKCSHAICHQCCLVWFGLTAIAEYFSELKKRQDSYIRHLTSHPSNTLSNCVPVGVIDSSDESVVMPIHNTHRIPYPKPNRIGCGQSPTLST